MADDAVDKLLFNVTELGFDTEFAAIGILKGNVEQNILEEKYSIFIDFKTRKFSIYPDVNLS